MLRHVVVPSHNGFELWLADATMPDLCYVGWVPPDLLGMERRELETLIGLAETVHELMPALRETRVIVPVHQQW